MIYTAKEIAIVILNLSQPEVGDAISNLKLQKLLYYCQGFNIVIYNRPLFKEDIVAWTLGPAVPEVFREYKPAGNSALLPHPDEYVDIDKESLDLINDVYILYGQFSALRLMEMVKCEAPYTRTPIGETITHEALINHFKHLVKD